MEDLIFRDNPLILASIVLVGLLATVELSYRYGHVIIESRRVPDAAWNAVYTGLLALVAFMLGFSYAQAQGRFDARRLLVVKEANAIGTTWLRADQLPPPQAARVRAILLRYAKLRLQAYYQPWNQELLKRDLTASTASQQQLWRVVSEALRTRAHNLGRSLLMQTLNDAIDVSAEQTAALTQHIPTSVVVLTMVLLFLAALSTGFSYARSQGRPAFFTVIYMVALTLVFQMAIDFDRPQSGFVHVSLDPLRAQIATMR